MQAASSGQYDEEMRDSQAARAFEDGVASSEPLSQRQVSNPSAASPHIHLVADVPPSQHHSLSRISTSKRLASALTVFAFTVMFASFVVIALGSIRVGGIGLAGSFALFILARILVPESEEHFIASRSKSIDVAVLAIFGCGIAILAFGFA